MRKSLLGVFVGVMAVSLGVSGCATKTYVQQEVSKASQAQDAKVAEVQKQVEANQMDISNIKKSDEAQNQQIAQLSDTAKEALQRAEEAGKVAKEAKAALDAFAQKVKDMQKNVYIEIQGNTDGIGTEAYNLKLGQERAEAVMRYLAMEHGFPLNRMSAISYGEFKPIADNKTRDGRAENRRVTLVVLE